MFQRERLTELESGIRAMIEGYLGNLWTALPAQVTAFNPASCTVDVQQVIQEPQTDPTGAQSWVTMTVFPSVPIIFPRGGGYSLTFPIAVGDEGLLVFSSRCIDAWWYLSGVQPQTDLRRHDLSDAFFLPGPYSKPKLPAVAPSTTTTQLRSDDGNSYYEIAADGTLNVKAATGKAVNLNASEVNFTSADKVSLTAPNGVSINGSATITRVLGPTSHNFGVLTIGSQTFITATMTVTGAKVGDMVLINPTNIDLCFISAVVSLADTLTVTWTNASLKGAVTAGGTITAMVIGFTP
jgi:hypothetical protein